MVFDKLRHTTQRARKVGEIARATRTLKKADEDNREAAQRALAALLADARGVPLKIGEGPGLPGTGPWYNAPALRTDRPRDSGFPGKAD